MQFPKSHKILYDSQTGAKLLTLKEAAKYLNYHPFSVYRLVSQGVLKPQRVGDRVLVFLEEDLDRYRASNEWAARKASIKHNPEAAKEDLPLTMTADVTVDLGFAPVWVKDEHIDDFSWQEIPLIKADLDERYGKKVQGFSIKVESPDGWKWHISAEPPTPVEKLVKKVKQSLKRKQGIRQSKKSEE